MAQEEISRNTATTATRHWSQMSPTLKLYMGEYNCRQCQRVNSNCPEPHETAQRNKSNCDVIYKFKKRNMMSLLD